MYTTLRLKERRQIMSPVLTSFLIAASQTKVQKSAALRGPCSRKGGRGCTKFKPVTEPLIFPTECVDPPSKHLNCGRKHHVHNWSLVLVGN